MAKLKAPLFSLGASGSLAKTLVYFNWKGINAVREHVVPTNPNTAAQQTQRGYMTAALAEFHGADYSEADITAWARLAGAEGLVMTGFNRMVKEFIDEAVAGNTWERIYNATFSAVGANNFDVTIKKAEGGNTPTCYYGTRKTYFPDSQGVGADGVDTWITTIAGLTASTLYYLYFSVGTPGTDYGRTGIYMQRTTA